MQQTEKYQLKLIESSDAFSAQPLNDNMTKVEAALDAASAAVAAHRTEVNAALATHRTQVDTALANHRTQVNTSLSNHQTQVNTALANHRTEVDTALSAHRAEVAAALTGQTTQLDAMPRMITGSYVGTGEYGASHPTVLEFPDAERPPQVIFITSTQYCSNAVLIRGMAEYCICIETYARHFMKVSWTDTGVRFYSTESSDFQLNSSRADCYYRYVALI